MNNRPPLWLRLMLAVFIIVTGTAPMTLTAHADTTKGQPVRRPGVIYAQSVPPGHDYFTRRCQSGEAATVCVNFSVNNTPDGPYWTMVKDEKYNPYGGPSQVSFRSISLSGYVLPFRTMNDGATHCWFPNPTYDGYPVSSCPPYGESHATAFDGANFATTYKVTVDPNSGSTSCYVLTPFTSTIVSGACPT